MADLVDAVKILKPNEPAELIYAYFPKTQSVTVPGLQIPSHDYISMSYTGANLTSVVYKTGGSGGTTVATLTLAYDGSSNLTSVTKS